jgi:hypothetical protein
MNSVKDIEINKKTREMQKHHTYETKNFSGIFAGIWDGEISTLYG